MGFSDKIRFFYQNAEDKWYSALDAIDSKISIYPIIDKIDAVFPSFMLFLILILIVLLGTLFFLIPPQYDFEANVTVTAAGIPLNAAEVYIEASCFRGDSVSGKTDSSGKTSLTVCNDEEYYVIVEKEGFQSFAGNLLISPDEQTSISLLAETIEETEFFLRVLGEEETPENIGVEMVCISDSRRESVPGESEEYAFTLMPDCSSLQLMVSADGYEKATHFIDNGDTRAEITLKKSEQKGTVIFESFIGSNSSEGIEITLTDEEMKNNVRFSGEDGFAEFDKIPAGNYDYSAIESDSGQSLQGTFYLNPGQTKEIILEFDEMTPEEIDDRKRIFIRVLDSDEERVSYAELKIFKGGTLYTDSKRTDLEGELKLVVDDSNTYKIVVTKFGFESVMVDAELKSSEENPQIISMRQGGAELKVIVVDEDEKRVRGSQTLLYTGGTESIDSSTTDFNGEVEFKGLPAGNYLVKTLKADSEGSTNVTLSQDETKEVTIRLVLGEGKISFRPENEEGASVNVNSYKISSGLEGTFEEVSSGVSSRNYFETPKLKHGNQVITEIEDGNYFPYESLVYNIYKGARAVRKPIVLTGKNLPNQTKIQMFLNKVYSTNPLAEGTPDEASIIEPGKRYYFLFSAILNPDFEETHDLLTNFVVGPENEESIVEHNPFSIDFVHSVKDSELVMSNTMQGMEINYNDFNVLTNNYAKQANIRISDATGPKQVPLLLVIDVDENAEEESVTKIIYNARWGETESLSYSKEFEIGKRFCLGSDCPLFLFSNYIKWDSAGEDYKIISEEERPELFLGDTYTMKTIVENTSSEAIGEMDVFTSQTAAEPKIMIDGEASQTNQIFVSPLETAEPIENEITTVESSSYVRINQIASKEENGVNVFEDREGIENEFRINVTRKDQLKIWSGNETVFAGAQYPMFSIRTTNDTLKEDISANWRISVKGEDEDLYTGTTDLNGTAITMLDATNLSEGDILEFTVYKSGFLDGKFELEVENLYEEEIVEEAECLSVDKTSLNINIGATNSFTITSDCDEESLVFIHTEQFVSPKHFDLAAGESKTITVTGTARDDIIGVYPLQVLSIEDSVYSQIANIDVVVSDPESCYSISDPIFDLKTGNVVEATITNECFEGRKDNFYPKATISTNSVSFTYDKPGNPATYDLNVPVYATSIESIVYGTIKAEQLYVYADGDAWYETFNVGQIIATIGGLMVPGAGWLFSGSIVAYELADGADYDLRSLRAVPTEVLETTEDEVGDFCEDLTHTGNIVEYPEPDLPEEEESDSETWDPSETVGEEGSSSTIIEDSNSGEFSAAEGKDKKEKSLKFQGTNTGFFEDYVPAANEEGELISGLLDLETLFEFIESNGGTIPTINSVPRKRGAVVTYFWDKWSDPFGNTTKQAKAVGSDVAADVTRGMGARGTAYESGDDPYWRWRGFGNINDKVAPIYKVISINHEEGGPKILVGGFGNDPIGESEGAGFFRIYAAPDCDWDGCDSSHIKLQLDTGVAIEYTADVTENTMVGGTFTPIEGKVYELGDYYDIQPLPRWLDVDDVWDGREPGDTFTESMNRFSVECIIPNGFIDFEHARDNGHQWADSYSGMPLRWQIKDPADPFVEYSSDGYTMYWIPPWMKEEYEEEGLDVYLRDGMVNVEYVGIPEIPGSNIDIEIANKNLRGIEYAILTIEDWVGDTREKKAIQVKLEGPPSNCYHPDGTAGFTGKEFSPRLLFDWEWNNIERNQCDYDNDDYTYCDATQFGVELFKKIEQIDDLYENNEREELGTVTSFYSYLIKDNYSQEFLEDFDEYYSASLADSDISFNSAGNNNGYDKFITENKINFENGDLPYGGLYLVTIDVEQEDKSLNTILGSGGTNATINVKFTLERKAQNYNPFYETPFDGKVGILGRNNYGSSVSGDELKLNKNVAIGDISGSSVQTQLSVSENLSDLDNQIILEYDSSGLINFNPSQPTPVVMKVQGTGNATAKYSLTGLGNTSNKTWKMVGSTMGTSTCQDFEESFTSVFTESEDASGNKVMSWNGVDEGTVELATTFFTPKGSEHRVQPENDSTTLKGIESLMNADTVELRLFDSRGIDNYDTVEGAFELLEEEKVCMSLDSTETLKLWWNPEYLEEELNRVNTETPGCN